MIRNKELTKLKQNNKSTNWGFLSPDSGAWHVREFWSRFHKFVFYLWQGGTKIIISLFLILWMSFGCCLSLFLDILITFISGKHWKKIFILIKIKCQNAILADIVPFSVDSCWFYQIHLLFASSSRPSSIWNYQNQSDRSHLKQYNHLK